MMRPIETITAPKTVYFAALVLIVSLVLSRDGKTQELSDFVTVPDSGFVAAPVEARALGLHWALETGPTGGPYQPSEFFMGVQSTEAAGAWVQRDNVFGLCFNMLGCQNPPYIPSLYMFAWTWEATYKNTSSGSNLIENNIGVNYVDGTYHRPWMFVINTDQEAALLDFSSTPGKVNFEINQNGNVVIGPVLRQPLKQLEVTGDALFTHNVDVSGNVTVAGLPVVTGSGSPSHGPLQWGISDGAQLNSASAVCALSRLSCQGAALPNGTQLSCSQLQPQGMLFFALCQ